MALFQDPGGTFVAARDMGGFWGSSWPSLRHVLSSQKIPVGGWTDFLFEPPFCRSGMIPCAPQEHLFPFPPASSQALPCQSDSPTAKI